MKVQCHKCSGWMDIPVVQPLSVYFCEICSKDIKNITRTKSEGLKHDSGKQPFFAMPLEVLAPLADVFSAGEKKYSTFNCLQPFTDSSRRFYDGMMRHAMASQIDPLAIDAELKEKYGVEVYHLAQIAFNSLMRLHHALKEREGTPCLPEDFDRAIQNEVHFKDLTECPYCHNHVCVCEEKALSPGESS